MKDISTIICFLILFISPIYSKNFLKWGSNDPWYDRRTNSNDAAGGNIFYLDRHSVYCNNNEVLIGFHLLRPAENNIMYEFKCSSNGVNSSSSYSASTGWNNVNSNWKESLKYLDRHQVLCNEGYGLNGFKISRPNRDSGQLRYDYTCTKVNNYSGCYKDAVDWTNAGNWNTFYLDRQYIKSEGREFIRGFHLQTTSSPEFLTYYIWKCNR
jgi:hypothetical protein